MLVFENEYQLASHFVNEVQADDEAQSEIIKTSEQLLNEVSPDVMFGRGGELLLITNDQVVPIVHAVTARNKSDKRLSTKVMMLSWPGGSFSYATVDGVSRGLFPAA